MSAYYKMSELIAVLENLDKLKGEFDTMEDYNEVVSLLLESPEYCDLLFPTKVRKQPAQSQPVGSLPSLISRMAFQATG